jgi:hypothetical protein
MRRTEREAPPARDQSRPSRPPRANLVESRKSDRSWIDTRSFNQSEMDAKNVPARDRREPCRNAPDQALSDWSLLAGSGLPGFWLAVESGSPLGCGQGGANFPSPPGSGGNPACGVGPERPDEGVGGPSPAPDPHPPLRGTFSPREKVRPRPPLLNAVCNPLANRSRAPVRLSRRPGTKRRPRAQAGAPGRP